MVYALEVVESPGAATEYLEFGRKGYPRLQCARGYFEMASKGNDFALATMGNGRWQHQQSDAKGMWVYHMLRGRVGDEVFWGTLAGILRDYAGRELTIEDVRASFEAAAPDARLDRFFADWLDRPGAPVLSASWTDGAQPVVTIEQTQAGEPYELDMTVEIEWADGRRTRESVRMDGPGIEIEPDGSGAIRSVGLDPDRELLIWREGYGPKPE